MSHKIENSKIICLFKVADKKEDQNISMAHSIAALNGLPTCIVQRATQVQNNFYLGVNFFTNYKFIIYIRFFNYFNMRNVLIQ